MRRIEQLRLTDWALRTLLIVLFATCVPLQCQTARDQPSQQSTKPLPQQRDLSVKAEIITQSYCHVDDEAVIVRMDIKLRFTNVSEHAVILAKRVESPPIVRAARTIDDAEKGDFEYDPNVDYFPTELPPSPEFGKKPDEEHFVILVPQQSYDARVTSGVFGATVAARAGKGSGLLAKGSHVLQLGVGVWPYQWPYFATTTDIKELSERWSKYGHLAYGFVYSDFVAFVIPDTFDNPLCKDADPR
jgi:hypothetical protein